MEMKTIISLAAPATTSFDSDRPATSCAWTKRKRSRRALPFHPQSEDEYLALCLIMLAHGDIVGNRKVSHRNGSASTEDDGDSGISSVLLLGETGRSHECSVCGRSFASGQALGGHKRSHFNRSGGKRVKGIGKSVSETSGGVRRCHDFDLNLLPPSEEAGGETAPLQEGSTVDCNQGEVGSSSLIEIEDEISRVV